MGETGQGPTFYTVVIPSGFAALVAADRTPWPQHIAITDELLDIASEEWLSHGDGMVRFNPHGSPGALYGYAHDSDYPGVRHYDLIRAGER